MEILGIDIGGTGIKGALVETSTGVLTQERYRVTTPQPAVPGAVADAVAEIVRYFEWNGPVGCTFPAVVKGGVMYTAANVDVSWIGTNGQDLFQSRTNCPMMILNDADAAGLAEMTFGAGAGHSGVVIILTFGTGIGSAIFVNGRLMPNTELGHLILRGKIAEARASDRARQEKELSWEKWSKRVNEYLAYLEFLFSPDLFIFGGGVSKKYEKFLKFLATRAEIVPARLFNDAGIVGAALAAESLVERS
jgi:polyphosphate glucokinase